MSGQTCAVTLFVNDQDCWIKQLSLNIHCILSTLAYPHISTHSDTSIYTQTQITYRSQNNSLPLPHENSFGKMLGSYIICVSSQAKPPIHLFSSLPRLVQFEYYMYCPLLVGKSYRPFLIATYKSYSVEKIMFVYKIHDTEQYDVIQAKICCRPFKIQSRHSIHTVYKVQFDWMPRNLMAGSVITD